MSYVKPPSPTMLTVKDLAVYLNVHPSTIYRMLNKTDLPRFKIGSDWRFHREAIDRWITEQSYK
jgi:excisionase family DNA binding protein